VYQKVNPADQPILFMALSSPTLPLYTVDEYAQTFLAQRISTISGVAQVFGLRLAEVCGARAGRSARARRAVHRDRRSGAAVARANVNKPRARCTAAHQAVNVQATGQLTDAAAYRPLVIAYRKVRPCGGEIAGSSTACRPPSAGWFQRRARGRARVQRQARHQTRSRSSTPSASSAHVSPAAPPPQPERGL